MTRRPRDVSERGLYALLAIVALLVIYLVAFVVANTDRVEISFVVFDARASLIWVMLVCTIIGTGVGIALSTLWQRSRGVRGTSRPGPVASTSPADAPPGGSSGGSSSSGGSGSSTTGGAPSLRRPTDPPA
jgi:uncharacterized integral membrane protein